jgi:hypothetical protein
MTASTTNDLQIAFSLLFVSDTEGVPLISPDVQFQVSVTETPQLMDVTNLLFSPFFIPGPRVLTFRLPLR